MVQPSKLTPSWASWKLLINSTQQEVLQPTGCKTSILIFPHTQESMQSTLSGHIKKSAARLLVVMLSCGYVSAALADKEDGDENVVERIQRESDGNVTITIPNPILELILQKNTPKTTTPEIRPGVNKLNGFRIQVFGDGRNQSTLEARAKARGSAILARFPKYRGQIYTYSSSPNWYTRIGNFRTNAEANAALAELKKTFPNYASEMRVVKCQIVVIKQ